MVKSPIAQKFRIEIHQTDNDWWIFTPMDVLTNVVIHWGRQSLFDAPMNRTLSFSVFVDRNKLEWQPGSYLNSTVRAYSDQTLLFEGAIDQVSISQSTKRTGKDRTLNGVILNFSAVESMLFYSDLVNQVADPSGVTNVWELWNRFQYLNYRQVEITPFFKSYTFEPFESDLISLGEAFSIAAAPFPFAHANWEPGHLKVHSTIYQPDRYDTPNVLDINAKSFTLDSPLTARIQDVPAMVILSTGGVAGTSGSKRWWTRDERTSVIGNRIPYRNTGKTNRDLEINHPWPTDHLNDPGDQTIKLISMQRTSPVNMTVYDDLRPFSGPFTTLFQTWEPTKDRYQIQWRDDNPVASAIGSNYLIPIGGTLKITPERTSHNLAMAYSWAIPL